MYCQAALSTPFSNGPHHWLITHRPIISLQRNGPAATGPGPPSGAVTGAPPVPAGEAPPLPASLPPWVIPPLPSAPPGPPAPPLAQVRSEEHTSELQSHLNLVCRLLLEEKNNTPA